MRHTFACLHIAKGKVANVIPTEPPSRRPPPRDVLLDVT
jgi:hypothetical protein